MTDEEKIQLLGEELIALKERFRKLCSIVKAVNDFDREGERYFKEEIHNIIGWGNDLADWLEGNLREVDFKYKDLRQMQNKMTYLDNELREIKMSLGLDGSVPTRKSNKYEYT